MTDWDRRELCPDGGCTGLIGPDGTCKVCGRAAPNWGDERKRGLDPQVVDADAEDDEEEDEDDTQDPIAPSSPAEIGEWATRRLCSDGACVGVIGADGTCNVCGKPAAAVAAAGEADEADDDDDDEYEGDDAAEASEDEDDEDEDDEDDAAKASDEGDEAEGDEDEGDEDEGDEDEGDADEGDADDDELAAAADQLAGIATHSELNAAKGLANAVGDSKPAAKAKAKAASSDDDRRLCPDGACIGVIGPDGKCKICKKEAA